jgi:chloramphenicol-sensitive protein RarD
VSTSAAPASDRSGGGVFHALGAHAIWGSMPLYLMLVDEVPVVEFVAWRTLFTLPVCFGIVLLTGAGAEMRGVLRERRTVATLFASAGFVAVNWLLYVWAIQTGHVYAASLGYYILPLTMMLLGLVVLGEKLTRLQWWAVGLAGLGVGALAAGALMTLWLSLSMAITFGIYGLLRKTVKAGPLVGLAVESLLLLPFAAGLIAWYAASPQGTVIGRDGLETFAIAMGGPMTAIPLILFATAARRMPYSVIGFLQFISPTIVFILGLTVFGEELRPAQLACFVAIWIAAGLFTYGLFRGSRPAPGDEEASRGAAA